MDKDLIYIATTKDAAKYADRACVEADEDFGKEFKLPDQPFRPFVNYFFYMDNANHAKISYHDNYSIINPCDFDPKPDLDGMVDKYLNVGIPGTTIRMVMPPLVITNPEGRDKVLKAFEKFGYDTVVDVPKTE